MAFRKFPCGHWSDSNYSTVVCSTCGRIVTGTDSKLSPITKIPYVPDSEIEEE